MQACKSLILERQKYILIKFFILLSKLWYQSLLNKHINNYGWEFKYLFKASILTFNNFEINKSQPFLHSTAISLFFPCCFSCFSFFFSLNQSQFSLLPVKFYISTHFNFQNSLVMLRGKKSTCGLVRWNFPRFRFRKLSNIEQMFYLHFM